MATSSVTIGGTDPVEFTPRAAGARVGDGGDCHGRRRRVRGGRPGTALRLAPVFTPGDVVRLRPANGAAVVRPDPRVDDARGQVVVERGPIVLCLESTDLPDGLSASRMSCSTRRRHQTLTARGADHRAPRANGEADHVRVALCVRRLSRGARRPLPCGAGSVPLLGQSRPVDHARVDPDQLTCDG